MSNDRIRMAPHERKHAILMAAAAVALVKGYNRINRSEVAKAANTSEALVQKYWTLPDLRREIMHYAIREEVIELVAQGLALGDRIAYKAHGELKRRAGEFVQSRG